MLGSSPPTPEEQSWLILIGIGIVAFIWWAWAEDRKEKQAQAARKEAERRELERLRTLYPAVPESQLRSHHERVLKAEAAAARQAQFEQRLGLCSSAVERRAVAKEFGDATITRREVLRRSNWRCGICGQGIKRSFKWDPSDDRCGTIDHVQPLNKGGTHEWSNVQASHWGCNKKKGDRW